MNTGLTSLAKLPEVAAEYPFQGMEVPFSFVILGFFILFMGWQLVMERKHHKAIIGNFTASPAE